MGVQNYMTCLNPLKQVKSFGPDILAWSAVVALRLNPLKQVKSFGRTRREIWPRQLGHCLNPLKQVKSFGLIKTSPKVWHRSMS